MNDDSRAERFIVADKNLYFAVGFLGFTRFPLYFHLSSSIYEFIICLFISTFNYLILIEFRDSSHGNGSKVSLSQEETFSGKGRERLIFFSGRDVLKLFLESSWLVTFQKRKIFNVKAKNITLKMKLLEPNQNNFLIIFLQLCKFHFPLGNLISYFFLNLL